MSAIRKSSVFVAAFLGMFVSTAHAHGIMTVTVPFPFVVGHKAFPAGPYHVRTADDAAAIVMIEGMNNRSAAISFTTPADGGDPAGNRPALVFTRYENEYRLAQIWESTTEGLALPEQSVVRRRAEAQPVASDVATIVLAANWK